MIGGIVVGMTSVGSGSLMIILLLFLYPMLGANQLVGTDLTQAVPLTAAAALGALAFGHVEIGVTASLVIGSVPAVLAGSLLSSSAPDRYVRPAITFVIAASGLKYVGVGTTAAGLDSVRAPARRRLAVAGRRKTLAAPAPPHRCHLGSRASGRARGRRGGRAAGRGEDLAHRIGRPGPRPGNNGATLKEGRVSCR